MSITLPIVDLSAATVGTTDTVSWIAVSGAIQSQATNASPATLWIFNESPCGLQLSFSSGEQPFLPAGGWTDMVLQPNCTSYHYSVAYVMTGALVTSLITVWFAPGEQVPRIPLLGNSPIGGTVGNVNANFLQGVSQALELTEVDDSSGFPALAPAAVINAQLGLGARDGTGAFVEGGRFSVAAGNPALTLFGSLTVDLQALFNQTFTLYNNELTAGLGIPFIVSAVKNTTVNTTISQTLCSYTTIADCNLRVQGYASLGNGTSGNNITFTVTYTDPQNVSRTLNLPFTTGTTAIVVMNGATSIANAPYAGVPVYLSCKTGTTVTVTYRDPTNTPNDRVSASIERLF